MSLCRFEISDQLLSLLWKVRHVVPAQVYKPMDFLTAHCFFTAKFFMFSSKLDSDLFLHYFYSKCYQLEHFLQKRNLNPRNAWIFPCGFQLWIKPVQSPCPPRARVLHQSINQSINQSIDRSNRKAPSHSINQSNKQKAPSHSVNQSINRSIVISKSVFSLNCWGLQVLVVFCVVLGKEKTNKTLRWGEVSGEHCVLV